MKSFSGTSEAGGDLCDPPACEQERGLSPATHSTNTLHGAGTPPLLSLFLGISVKADGEEGLVLGSCLEEQRGGTGSFRQDLVPAGALS